jgi:hypothetical protein
MNLIKPLLSLLVATLSLSSAFAQKLPYYLSDSLFFIDANNQLIPKATSGGFHCPQFSPCDLNGDGKKDIVAYDKLDGSISTYINKGTTGEVKYQLDNRYAAYFPKMRAYAWMLMRDFNNDGYEDIFTIGTQSYVVYKNISYTVTGRPAFVELPALQYRNMSASGSAIEYNAMSTPSIHLPGIYDIDFDGDLDIMSYSNVGGAITLWMNYQVEMELPSDSMRYFLTDLCWGYFNDFDCNSYIVNTCSEEYWRLYGQRHTAGSSITLFDANNDKDIDLLIGNEGCSHMTMLYNAKNNHTKFYDSFYLYDTNYVAPNNRADVSIYPAAYFMDVDNDGRRDLIYAPNSTNFQYVIEETNQVRWFRNIGTDSFPSWGQQQELFTNQIIDNGNHSSWASADWDKDGDNDLIAAVNGNAFNTRDTADRIYLYENVGTAKAAQFKLKSSNFGNFIPEKINSLTIAAEDMDNDGKIDLVCGNDKGEILFFRNTSGTANTLTPTFQRSNSTFTGFNIDIGGFSAPAIADINRDGLKDLVIGRNDSMLSYYRNIGTLSNPNFSIVTSKFGNIKAFDSIGFQYVYDDTFAIIGYFPVYEKSTYSKPAIMDIDGDDTLEIVVANSLGTIRMYRIDGSKPTSTFESIDSFHYRKGVSGDKFYNPDMGNFTSVCLSDLDNDSVPEILVPLNRGGIQYMKPAFAHKRHVSINDVTYRMINGYPNPTSSAIEFAIDQGKMIDMTVYNSLGQVIPVDYTESEHILTLNTSSVSSGFYIVNIRLQDNTVYTSRFQVIH